MSKLIDSNRLLRLAAMTMFAISAGSGCGSLIAEEGQDASTESVEARELVVEKVVTEAVSGEPLGAGRIELTYLAGHGPVIYPDQRLVLESSDKRARYITFDVEFQPAQPDGSYQVKRIEALFLLQGDGPIDLALLGPDGDLIQDSIKPVAGSISAANRIRQQWWERFSTAPDEASVPERELHHALLEILARRHGLSLPIRMTSNPGNRTNPSPGLEAQFERAVGMLFGIESVKLAMQDDVTLRESTRQESATQPIPTPPRMRSLQVPAYPPVPIERIAMRVPAECFYLRTGNLSNYFHFRDFIVGWGGSLDDIVSPRAFDFNVRRKLETQLGLDTTKMKVGEWDNLVSDLALIGCDPLFHDGAAVGVLLESNSPQELVNRIQQQRAHLRQQHPDAQERRITIRNRWVSMLSTSDHRIRSFYVIDGPYHFITNSEHLLDRFLDTHGGHQSLGQLNEFRYAKSKAKSSDSTRAFLYLSDPFFQNLISPHYRIEMTRRAAAKRALQQLRLAHLVAQAESIPTRTTKDLVAANLLEPDFAKRADGSFATCREDEYFDTLRGARGTFLPVPDVPLQKATWAEVSAYKRFIADYNREWGRIDPVTVVFSRQHYPDQDGLDQNHLEIMVAPYARQRYALLDTHLADASWMQLTPIEGDLISVQAAVRLGHSSPAHLLSIGLQDDEVPFVLEHGKIKRLGTKSDDTFAKTRCYAAITPPSTDVLRMLASVLLEGKSPPRSSPTRPFSQPRPASTLVPLPLSTPKPIQALYYLGWMFANMPPGALGATKYLSMIDTRDNITVVAESGDIRDRVHACVAKQPATDPHEVKLKMTSLKGSKVEPYIQAYTYIDARRRSTQNALLLDRWTEWLRLPPAQARHAVEELLGAKVCCPLGGNLVASSAEKQSQWGSTAWNKASRFEVDNVPSDWKFPFLHWLHGMAVDFDLEQNTLTASVHLSTQSSSDARGENSSIGKPLAVTIDNDSQYSVQRASVTVTAAANETKPESDWVLGVRVSGSSGLLAVSSIYPQSPASRVGIRHGDVIRKVNGQVPSSPEELRKLIRHSQKQGFVWIEMERAGAKIRMRVLL